MIRSYPSLFILSFVLAGIILANGLELSPYPWLLLGLIGFFAALYVLTRKARSSALLLLGLTFGLLTAFHFSLEYVEAGPHSLKRQVRESVRAQVYGRVADWPKLKTGGTDLMVAIDSLDPVGGPVRARRIDGSLLLRISDTTTALQRGDRVSFIGRLYPLQPNRTERFDYRRYLNLKGVQAVAYLPTSLGIQVDRRPSIGYLALVDGLRGSIRDCLDRNLSERGAALARGFLIGETRDIPADIYGMFRDSGTLHLLAVSGSNVALVILFTLWLMRPFWLGPVARAVLLAAVVTVFAGLSYGDPSVVRASLMAFLVIGARLLGRPYNLNQVIATTALIILLVDPAQLFDVGFQLSFVTAWGLIFIMPKIVARFKPWHDRWWYRWLLFPLALTVVAQLCATPIVAYYFGRVPVISPLANLLVVPAVAVGVVSVLGLLVADLIWPLLGAFVGSLVDLWLNLVVVLLRGMGGESIPVLTLESLLGGAAGRIAVMGAYLLVVLSTLAITLRWARRLVLVFLLLAVNLALVAAAWQSSDRPELALTLHRVPGGVAAIVTRPEQSTAVDLVLTGLARRPYALDEKILKPMLARQGVDKIGRVILLAAEYDALDDLLRTAADHRAEQFYVAADLRGSLLDVINGGPKELRPAVIRWFGGPDPLASLPGYHLSRQAVRIKWGHTDITLTGQVTREILAAPDTSGVELLVIGERWSPTPSDWVRLHRIGYDRIICAKLAQSSNSLWPDRETDVEAPPDYICDLAREGICRLDLSF